MPYAATHKPQSRLRILQSAFRLFTQRGYDGVSIDDVMADAELTRGAFYAHFKAKADLYAEAIIHGGRQSEIARLIAANPAEVDLTRIINGYLSRAHLNGKFSPCPLAFLSSDVGVRDARVREAYTRVFQALSQIVRQRVEGDDAADSDVALAITALMIGGVAVGNAITDDAMAERLLENCRRAALALAQTAAASVE